MKGIILIFGLTIFYLSSFSQVDQTTTDLRDASGKGDIEKVKTLLAVGKDVNEMSENGMTALMLASKNDHTEVVRLLLAAKADVNIKNKNGITALIWACDGHTEVVRLLLAAGADVNARSVTVMQTQSSAIALADGYTPLMCASAGGYVEVVKLLLAAKADVNAEMTLQGASNGATITNFPATALAQASAMGNTKVVALLKAAGAKK
jgi:ankyrin repeat protein